MKTNTMKSKFLNWISFSFMAMCLAVIPACFTTNTPPETPEQATERRERRAKRIVEMAAYDAAFIELDGEKNTAKKRAVFMNITNELATFMAEANPSPVDAAAYVKSLPIGYLKTVEGQLIASGVLIIIDETFGDQYQVNTSQLKPIIEAGIRGFGRAIEYAERNPYVPPAPKQPKSKVGN
jgi:hypothetical protein